jgi:hypothetical protein
MPQIILVTGTILASSVGLALTVLILRNAISNSRRKAYVDGSQAAEFAGTSYQDLCPWNLDVRGYDHPELAWEDILMRTRLSSREPDRH